MLLRRWLNLRASILMLAFRLRTLLYHRLSWSFPDGWRLVCCDAHRDCSCWENDKSQRLVHIYPEPD